VKLQELKNLVQITVSSFGIIIPEKERSKIFPKAFSLEFQKLVTGTGMELHNAKELLKVFKCLVIKRFVQERKVLVATTLLSLVIMYLQNNILRLN
jgi:signal transduction histidine kinase